jgi:hypothetical protein
LNLVGGKVKASSRKDLEITAALLLISVGVLGVESLVFLSGLTYNFVGGWSWSRWEGAFLWVGVLLGALAFLAGVITSISRRDFRPIKLLGLCGLVLIGINLGLVALCHHFATAAAAS